MFLLLAAMAAVQPGAPATVLRPGAELYPVDAPEITSPVDVAVELSIDKEGRATACHVTGASRYARLNTASCELAETHMRLASRTSDDVIRLPVRVAWVGRKASDTVFLDGAVAVSPENALTSDDYPKAALREGRGGGVGYRFDISTTGSVENCTVTRSSGYEDLDAAACKLVSERMDFLPALSPDGQPRIAHARSMFTWNAPTAGPGETHVQVTQTRDGLVCKVDVEGQARELTDEECSGLAEALRQSGWESGEFITMKFDGPIPLKPAN